MKQIIYNRICYKDGKITEQKMFEVHKLCDATDVAQDTCRKNEEIEQWHM